MEQTRRLFKNILGVLGGITLWECSPESTRLRVLRDIYDLSWAFHERSLGDLLGGLAEILGGALAVPYVEVSRGAEQEAIIRVERGSTGNDLDCMLPYMVEGGGKLSAVHATLMYNHFTLECWS